MVTLALRVALGDTLGPKRLSGALIRKPSKESILRVKRLRPSRRPQELRPCLRPSRQQKQQKQQTQQTQQKQQKQQKQQTQQQQQELLLAQPQRRAVEPRTT